MKLKNRMNGIRLFPDQGMLSSSNFKDNNIKLWKLFFLTPELVLGKEILGPMDCQSLMLLFKSFHFAYFKIILNPIST